jgi:integrase
MKTRMEKKKDGWPRNVAFGRVVVKVYRRVNGSGNPNFMVANYAGLRRRFDCWPTEEKALSEALKLAQRLSEKDTLAAKLTEGQALDYTHAMQQLVPLNLALPAVVANYVAAVGILGADLVVEAVRFYDRHRADKIVPRTVAEVVSELIASRESQGKSQSYVDDLRVRLARFAGNFNCQISTVTGPDLQRWIETLKVAPRTAKNFRGALHVLFKFAGSHGYIIKGSNPVEDTDSIVVNNSDAVEIFTPAEILALLNAAPPDFKPFVAFGAFAGLRSAEIQRLEWKDIDIAGGFIELVAAKTKTRSHRIVPILPNLNRWIASFTSQSGKVSKLTPKIEQKRRNETAKASGVKWKANGLRHSFISYRMAVIQNAAQVSIEAGNSPAIIFKNYRKPIRPDAGVAYFGIIPEGPANIVPMATAVAL